MTRELTLGHRDEGTERGARAERQGARGRARDASHNVRSRCWTDVSKEPGSRTRHVDRPVQRDPHDVHELSNRRRVSRRPGTREEGVSQAARLVGHRAARMGRAQRARAAAELHCRHRPAARRPDPDPVRHVTPPHAWGGGAKPGGACWPDRSPSSWPSDWWSKGLLRVAWSPCRCIPTVSTSADSTRLSYSPGSCGGGLPSSSPRENWYVRVLLRRRSATTACAALRT